MSLAAGAAVSAVVSAALSLASLSADDRVRFDVTRDGAAQDCPSTEVLAARVRARIGSEPFSDDDGARRVHVRLQGERGAGLSARVTLVARDGSAAGQRTLRGPQDCEELSEQLVLAVAIAIDPLLLLRPSPSSSDAEVPAVADTPVEPLDERDAARDDDDATERRAAADASRPRLSPTEQLLQRTARERRPPRGFGVRALVLGSSGIASPIAAGARVAAGFQGQVFSFEGGLRAALPARLLLGASAGAVDVGLIAVQAAPGVGLLGDVAALRGALVVEGGALLAQGVGLADARFAAVPWLALGARGGMDIMLTRVLVLVVEAEALVPVFRPRFVDGQTGRVFSQAEPLAWDAGVGVALLLP